MSPSNIVLALVALVLAAASVACGKETVTKVVTATPESGEVAGEEEGATPRPSATPKASPTPDAAATIGDTLETDAGDTFTVYVMERNVASNSYFPPPPGREYVAFDVEVCSGPNTDDLSPNPYYWSLRLADNTSADPTFGGKEPGLTSEELFASDCLRGWVTFEVPQDAPLESLRLDDFRHKAKWDIR